MFLPQPGHFYTNESAGIRLLAFNIFSVNNHSLTYNFFVLFFENISSELSSDSNNSALINSCLYQTVISLNLSCYPGFNTNTVSFCKCI